MTILVPIAYISQNTMVLVSDTDNYMYFGTQLIQFVD